MSKYYRTQHGLVLAPEDVDITIVENGEEVPELKANSTDAAGEKHVPEVTVDGNTVTVRVGSVDHPMLAEHWINDVYLVTDKGMYERKLNPGEEPVAVFTLQEDEVPVEALEFCNLHGLWKKEI